MLPSAASVGRVARGCDSTAPLDLRVKAMRETVRCWQLHCRSDLGLNELVRWTRPVLCGWAHYYARFCPAALRLSAKVNVGLPHFV